MPKIKIHYFSADAPRLKMTDKGNWIDLYCAETMELHAGILQANSVGVIDNSYCGTNDEWKLPVYATRDTVLEKGDRICQFRIYETQPPIEFEECDELSATDRGGFGSTGRK